MDESEEYLLKGNIRDKNQKRQKTKKIALILVGILTLAYSLGELVVAVIYTGSLALLSDGFHNLSDVISIIIAYWAIMTTNKIRSEEMSYGWKRAEVLGGLINGSFLLSLSVYVFLEAVPRFFNPIDIENDNIFLIVAGIGFGVNLTGAILFGITGVHTHSHSHPHHDKYHHRQHIQNTQEENIQLESKSKKPRETWDWNMWAVFIHYLTDALSSICVLVTGILIFVFRDESWIAYLDPLSGVLIVLLILLTTIPLVKKCSQILLQSAPENISIPNIKFKISQLQGVVGIHEFHVWQLMGGLNIATVHIQCIEGVKFEELVKQIKGILHEANIHSSAIQPEFVPVPSNNSKITVCQQNCIENCTEEWCCKAVEGIELSERVVRKRTADDDTKGYSTFSSLKV
jgi:zinc transporter 1